MEQNIMSRKDLHGYSQVISDKEGKAIQWSKESRYSSLQKLTQKKKYRPKCKTQNYMTFRKIKEKIIGIWV